MYTRTCALEGCEVEFQTDNRRKKHCCPAHSNLHRVRRWKAKHRKGGGPGGGGGGRKPTLFDTIKTEDEGAFYVPGPITGKPTRRKPAVSVPDLEKGAANAAAA